MDQSILSLLLLQVVLIFLNAVFACAEIAVLSINELKLERMAESGNKKARRLYRLTQEPAKFLATIQVAITLSGFLGSAFAADNFSEPLVEWVIGLGVPLSPKTLEPIIVILITLILSYFTLVFGELVPKRIAMKKSEQIALGISGVVKTISVLFKPIVSLLSLSTNMVLRLFGIDPNEAEDEVSEEEIRTLVDAGSEKGTIDLHEKEWIQNVFEFNDIAVGDIVVHRIDVCALWLEDDAQVWKETIYSKRHTRYPICDGSLDRVAGILHAEDYFRLEDQGRESVLQNAVSPAYFVAETVKADVLFREMKKDKEHFAVVLDEYGGMVGIVTIFDLLEELVGDLNDESDNEDDPEPYIEPMDATHWHLVGNVSLEELAKATSMELLSKEHDTITGLVFDHLGKVPPDGEAQLDVCIQDVEIVIHKVSAHQIEDAVLTLHEHTPDVCA